MIRILGWQRITQNKRFVSNGTHPNFYSPCYNAKHIKRWLGEFDKSLNEKFLKVFQRIVKEIR